MDNNECRWGLETHWFIGYETECGEVTDGEPLNWTGDDEDIIGADYVFCPYCGHKIRKT